LLRGFLPWERIINTDIFYSCFEIQVLENIESAISALS